VRLLVRVEETVVHSTIEAYYQRRYEAAVGAVSEIEKSGERDEIAAPLRER